MRNGTCCLVILTRLSEYAKASSTLAIRLMPALDEATASLNAVALRAKNLGDADIVARTELSRARQSLAAVKGVLFGGGAELGELGERSAGVEAKIDDLLQYIDMALKDVRQVNKCFDV